MKNIFIIPLLIFALIFVSSCKDSGTGVPPTNEPVVLFTRDSLGLSSSDSGLIGLGDSVQYDIDTTAKSIKLEYRMESSGGAEGDWIFYGVFLSKTGVSFFSDYGYMSSSKTIDTSYTFDVSSYKGLTLQFKVLIEKKTDHSFRFVKFKNMKLTKLN